jgi:hypothetical protein
VNTAGRGSGTSSKAVSASARGRGANVHASSSGRGRATSQSSYSANSDLGTSSASSKIIRKKTVVEAPTKESQVRRSERNHNEGFKLKHAASASDVPAATPPQVLQVKEMQRIGIEECLIDPDELTVERLTKAPSDQ